MSEEVFNTTSSFPQDQGKNIRVSANINGGGGIE